MSIIQEAIKKAERQIKDPRQPAPSVHTISTESPSRIKEPEVFGQQAGAKKPSVAGRDPKAVAILIAILVVTAVVAASQLFPKKNISEKPSVADETAGKPAAVAVNPDSAAPSILPNILFQQPKPSAQSEGKKLAPPEFVLNGIMYLEGGPRAIINDSMVEVGDAVDGALVVKIEKKSVLLQHNDIKIILELK